MHPSRLWTCNIWTSSSQVLTLEALYLGVARPSFGARAGWTVLLGLAEGVAAARVLHQARVHADLVDARLVRRAVDVGAAGGLQGRNCNIHSTKLALNNVYNRTSFDNSVHLVQQTTTTE